MARAAGATAGGRISAAALLLLLVGVSVGQQGPVPPAVAVPPQDIAALLPQKTLVHVMISGSPVLQNGSELAVAKIFSEPEMLAFLRPLEAFGRRFLADAEGQERPASGVAVQSLLPLLRGTVTVSLVGLQRRSGGPGLGRIVPDVVITVTPETEAGDLEALVQGLGEILGFLGTEGLEDITLGGVPMKAVSVGPIEICYGVHGRRLVAGTNRETLVGVFARLRSADGSGSLAESPLYQKARKEVARPRSVLLVYAETRRLLDVLLKQTPVIEQTRDALALWGLDGVQVAGYGLDLDGPGFRDRVFLLFGERRGWFAAQCPTGAAVRSAEFLPADCAFYTANLVNFDAAYDAVLALLDNSYAKTAREWRQWVARFVERGAGLNLRDDLLAGLGPEYGLFASFPGQALVPDVGAFIQVRDRKRIEHSLAALLDAAGDRWVCRRLDFRGHEIRCVELASAFPAASVQGLGPFANLKISWALVGEYLVVAPWPQVIKNLIHGLEDGTPRLRDRADFAQGVAHLRAEDPAAGSSGLSYLDLASAFGFLLDNAAPILQSVVPRPVDVPLELAAFPRGEAITRHLFGMVGASRWTGEGFLTDIWSPIGMAPGYAGVLAAAAGLWLAPAEDVSESVPLPGGKVDGPAAARERARLGVLVLRNAVQVHLLVEGRLPEEAEWPGFLFSGTRNHPKPYVDEGTFTGRGVRDPWGNPFEYHRAGPRTFKIVCLGADGKPGGEGDAADIVASIKVGN